MNKYKVLAEVEINGEMKAVGSEVELEEAVAAPLVAEGKLEPVAAEAAPEA